MFLFHKLLMQLFIASLAILSLNLNIRTLKPPVP